MPPATGDDVDAACRAISPRHECVDQRRLADTGVTDQHRHAIGEVLDDNVEIRRQGLLARAARHRDGGHVECGIGIDHRSRIGEIGLGEDEERRQARVVGRHERTVDEAESRLGIGQRDHDPELVGVGDDHALDIVGVICGTPQDRLALLDLDNAREGVCLVGDVADQAHAIAHDDALAPELASLDGQHRRAVVGDHGEATAIDGGDERGRCVVMGGSVLGPRPRLATRGADADVVLVQVPTAAVGHQRPASMRCHMPGKSGSVLVVASMPVTCTPGTTSPITAAAVAMR